MKNIRTSKLSKVIASYLAIQLILMTVQPMQVYALTGGPSQPEFNSFTPIGTSDMVNLSSGDFNYNIPIMDVGGYPLNLAYDSGITMDQEASWVGLGWNLNVGQISRQLRGLPDDFNGDEVTYENNLRNNFTAGVNTGIAFPIFGFDFLNLNLGLGMEYNNYNGITFNTSYGASFDISEQVSAGLNITSSSGGEASVEPTVGITAKKGDVLEGGKLTTNIGVPFSSMQGLQGLSLSSSASGKYLDFDNKSGFITQESYSGGKSSFLSFNDNLSYSPTNKLRFVNANLTLQFALGLEFFGSEGPQGSITGFGSIQALRNVDKVRNVNAYGYLNTENASTINSVLDFNRENDKTVTTNTTMLPIVNQTYDLYAIRGQGIGGMFRPHRSQVSHVFDETISYYGIGGSASLELGPGLAVHFGGNAKVNPSYTRSGRWQGGTNTVLNDFRIRNNETSQKLNYEPVYYKSIGELTADTDATFTNSIITEKNPIKIGIGGGEYNRRTESPYKVKTYNANNTISYQNRNITKIKRGERNVRTQSIQMIEYGDVKRGGDGQIRIDALPDEIDGNEFVVPDNHQVGAKILKPDGSTYVFGEAAYNTKKVEATFALGSNNGDCVDGLVNYSNNEDSRNNSSGRDHYFNKIHTPAYAHSYLLSSVLSSDYEDLTNDGPTDDDLGAYTKFTYSTPFTYNWRVPFSRNLNVATYSQGLRTDGQDDKGNYVYGEKELKYINKIETKTHIAIFELSNREDATEASGEDGGIGNAKMQKLDKVSLYSKPEYLLNPQNAEPIKVAHFEYDYTLCNNIPSHSAFNNGTQTGPGKLTLKKVYFTYRGSNMGQYTPYQFNYPEENSDLNPNYNIKAYDVWGNYKPISAEAGCGVNDEVTTAEFPFVQQDNRDIQDQYASAWTMTSIDLPSGGKMELEYETDDYGYVQNKHAMQMFKVVGAGDDDQPSNLDNSNRLYEGSDDFDYIYVQIDNGTSVEDFKTKYLKDIGQSDDNPMYFRFMLNMTGGSYDYVTGYALAIKESSNVFTIGANTYGSIRLKRVKKEGGIVNSNQLVNPIAKAGWYFGRKNLNRQVNGLEAPNSDEPGNLIALGQAFVNALGSVQTIFIGPNQYLKDRGVAKRFSTEKSWIRLYHPDETKFGGGIRVKNLKLHDNWDTMTNNEESPNSGVYKNFYGQDYNYNNTDGSSSGVATFEPNGSKENPLIQPFYDKHEKLIAPKESNYTEKPVGQSMYPSPTVTYGRVTVSNLKREREYSDVDDNLVTTTLKKHATGRVINEFYTSKDFPTIADFTDITPKVDITGILGSILKVRTNKSLTYSQGFVVRTNDMNGKAKSQKVQTEGQSANEYISQVEYKYSVNGDGSLDNELDIVMSDGTLDQAPIGVTYDMVHDFRSYYNSSTVMGVDGNLAAIFVFIGILPTPTLLPVLQFHEQELKTATTTKVIHSVGVLKEKIAYDLGSKVSTENLAWDGQTGDVILTKTVNEYGDHYFNFNYPANWHYEDMGPASNNLDTRGIIEQNASTNDFNIVNPITNTVMTDSASENFTLGDELLVKRRVGSILLSRIEVDRVWVAKLNGNRIFLIDDQGQPFQLEDNIRGDASFKIHRSGYRNLQTAGMASVTLQENPIVAGSLTSQEDWVNLNVVNANAVEYADAWNLQCEFRLPNPDGIELNETGDVTNIETLGFNPYLYNVKGDWRAIKSYAYLTGRNNSETQVDPRNEGFFNTYKPFYKYNGSWSIDNPTEDPLNKWTYASEVTAYSPYGAELENKDALDRFSAAQYGYRYTLPTAVGSNTEYRELAFDGFEDYAFAPLNGDGANPINPHFGYQDEVIDNPNASITNLESHSGRNSIRLQPGSIASIEHRIVDCDTIVDNNSIPNALNDIVSNCGVSPRGVITITPLTNDSFGDDGPSSGAITITTQPTHGSAQVNNNGTPSDSSDDFLTYTVIDQNANDSFTYQICDSDGDCDTASIIIYCISDQARFKQNN